MSGPESVHSSVVVGEGVFERRREALAAMETARARGREVISADLADMFLSVPLALLGWVGRVKGEHRWVCQVHDPDNLRTCGQVGQADTEQGAIDHLTIHICHDHGGLPE